MFKDLKKIEIFALFAILLLYFFTRLVTLNNFPIFTDEAIYLRWAQIAKNDANWRFISLTDGKQPLYIWLTMISMKLIKDPIIAGRIVSVFSGLGTIVGLIILGKILFKKWMIGMAGAVLYTIFPFAFVYDRMALMDGLLATFMVWSLLFEILLIRTLRLDVALILGGLIGFAALTKTSGFIALYFLPFLLLLFDLKGKDRFKRLIKYVCLCLIVFVISELIYAILRLSPYFHIIAQKDKTFIYGFSEWLKYPFTFFFGNLKGLLNWASIYLSWPWVLVILISFFLNKKLLKEKIIIFLWFIIPLSGLALFGRVIYPRFIFFMIVPLILLVGNFVFEIGEKVNKKWLILIILFLLSLIPGKTTYDLFQDPTIAKIPGSDSNQYFNDWPSGWGIKESIDFFEKEAKKNKITVYTEGTFGLLPAALEMYLFDNKNINIKGIWPVPQNPPKEVLATAQKMPTYIIFFQYSPSPQWLLKEILKVKKGNAERYHYVYQVEPQNIF